MTKESFYLLLDEKSQRRQDAQDRETMWMNEERFT